MAHALSWQGFGPSVHRRGMAGWADRLAGSDLGLTRLRSAVQATATMAAAMAAEVLFVHTSGALQLTAPAGAPATVLTRADMLDHATLMIAVVLGTMIGFMAGFAGPMAGGGRGGIALFCWMPVPLVAGLAAGLAVGAYRVPTLVGLVAVFAAGTYARRFGPRGFLGGILGFIGYFLGFFLRAHAGIGIADLGWLAAEVGVGVLVAVLIQSTVFFPARRPAARRAMRSYLARSDAVIRLALSLFDSPDGAARERLARRLGRRLDRLNEAALVVDVRLAALTGPPAEWPPAQARQFVLDHEDAVAALAQATSALPGRHLPETVRGPTRRALAAVARRDLAAAERAAAEVNAGLPVTDNVGPGRRGGADQAVADLASAVAALGATSRRWRAPASPTGAGQQSIVPTPPEPAATPDAAVPLFGGWLPGSTLISREASQTADGEHRSWSGLRLSPHVRASIQMIVAGAVAITLGDLLSGYRYYWSALAAFFILVGTNNTGEQVRKGAYRVMGTAVGVAVGIPIAHLAGRNAGGVIAVVLVSLFLGMYLIRISYALMIIGVTVAVAELYVEFGEFTDGLLLLRLEETAIGAAVTALTVLVVIPLRPARVARAAAGDYAQTLTDLTRRTSTTSAVADVRELDAAYQALLSTTAAHYAPYGPLTAASHGDQPLPVATRAHYHARGLLTQAGAPPAGRPPGTRRPRCPHPDADAVPHTVRQCDRSARRNGPGTVGRSDGHVASPADGGAAPAADHGRPGPAPGTDDFPISSG